MLSAFQSFMPVQLNVGIIMSPSENFLKDAPAWLTQRYAPHPTCVTKFGSSATKVRTPKIGEPWNSTVLGWEAWLTPRYTPFPTFGSLRQRVHA